MTPIVTPIVVADAASDASNANVVAIVSVGSGIEVMTANNVTVVKALNDGRLRRHHLASTRTRLAGKEIVRVLATITQANTLLQTTSTPSPMNFTPSKTSYVSMTFKMGAIKRDQRTNTATPRSQSSAVRTP